MLKASSSWMVKEVLFLFLWAIFPKIPTIFPNVGKNEGFFGGRGMILPFSLHFNPLFLLLLIFSEEMPDFSQNRGFFGEVVGKGLFCLGFRSTFAASKKQDNAEMVW